MRNYINKNIDTSIEWSRSIEKKPKGKPRPKGKVMGLNIFDKKYRVPKKPDDYCGSIEITTSGTLQIWTDGKYQFIKKEIAMKLVKELLKRYEESVSSSIVPH